MRRHQRTKEDPSFITNYQQLFEERAHHLIFRCVAGSRAYGTNTPQSDTDYRGIYVLPGTAYLTLGTVTEQLSNESNDHTYYALRRFLELAAAANPNIIELLYTPDDCIALRTPFYDRLMERAGIFMSKRAFESHAAYAYAQVKRARGQNKWINNPKPEAPPRREDWCWFVPLEPAKFREGALPYRPIRVSESGLRLEECHVAALEHGQGAYRLYHYGEAARGVFRGGNIVCESIPLADETACCLGLLIFNEGEYERATRDHKSYWDWRRNRNEARWVAQERGAMDYDAKNMMHTMRLLLCAENIFREGRPLVRFEGEKLRLLLGIRNGEFSYEALIAMAEERMAELTALRDRSELPDEPDAGAAADLLREVTTMWEVDHA